MTKGILSDGKFALGILLGLLVTLFGVLVFDLFGLRLFEDRLLLGTVLGALIAGGIAIVGQLLVITSHRQRDTEERAGVTKARVVSLFQGLNMLLTVYNPVLRHIESEFKKAEEEGIPFAIAVLPLSNIPNPVLLKDSDKAELLFLGEYALFNEVSAMDVQITSTIGILQRCEREREKLMKLVELVSDEDGIKVRYAESEKNEVLGRISVLNEKYVTTRDYLTKDITKVSDLLDRMVPLLRTHVASNLELDKLTPVKPAV